MNSQELHVAANASNDGGVPLHADGGRPGRADAPWLLMAADTGRQVGPLPIISCRDE